MGKRSNRVLIVGGGSAFHWGSTPSEWTSWYGYISGSANAPPAFAFTELELLAQMYYDSWS
jgi:hypothetical protein